MNLKEAGNGDSSYKMAISLEEVDSAILTIFNIIYTYLYLYLIT